MSWNKTATTGAGAGDDDAEAAVLVLLQFLLPVRWSMLFRIPCVRGTRRLQDAITVMAQLWITSPKA